MEFQNFDVRIDNKQLIRDFNWLFEDGTTMVVIGRNGCGKSTFAHAVMGRDDIETHGKVLFRDQDLLELETNERASNGVFVSWQTPPEIAGITSFGLIRDIKKISAGNMGSELKKYKELLEHVELPSDWANRQLNVGGSGGERKRAELVNLEILQPHVAILDEIDTGLDTNGLQTVSGIINKRRQEGKINLVITHNKNLLEHLDYDGGFIFKYGKLENISKEQVRDTLTDGYK